MLGIMTSGDTGDIQQYIRNIMISGGGSGGDGTTVFNADGSIVTTYTDGVTLTTKFPSSDQVTETLKDVDGTVLQIKTTTFNADGSITEQTTNPS